MVWVIGGALVVFFLLRSNTPAESNLNPAQVREWMSSKKDLQLIDVRTPGEFAQGHLQGARLMPMSSLAAHLKSLDPNRPLIAYCLTGRRSGHAVKILLKSGFPEAKHLAGGISAWQSAGLPVTR